MTIGMAVTKVLQTNVIDFTIQMYVYNTGFLAYEYHKPFTNMGKI